MRLDECKGEAREDCTEEAEEAELIGTMGDCEVRLTVAVEAPQPGEGEGSTVMAGGGGEKRVVSCRGECRGDGAGKALKEEKEKSKGAERGTGADKETVRGVTGAVKGATE